MTQNKTDAKYDPSDRFLKNSVMIIDPQWVCRNGLKHLILEHTDHNHVVEASDIDDAGKGLARWDKIGFIIMELRLPGIDPVEAFETICEMAGNIPILAMSDNCSREEILGTINLGAAGIITKSSGEEEILHAISAVERGEIQISRSLFEKADALEKRGQRTRGRVKSEAMTSLTQRQREVLEELGRGQSNRAIAEKLHVSEHTVKIHVAAILKTLGVANRTQAALLAQPTDAG